MNILVTFFLCGDVMTGRGIDQVLPHPGDPALHESYVRDARDYVELAESGHGPIGRSVPFEAVWGDALGILDRVAPDIRLINLETSVTRSDDPWPGKPVHYRMHPDNVPVLRAAKIDVCALANNHVLDWGHAGMRETLSTLHAAGMKTAGAGRDAAEAGAPAVSEIAGKGRVLVFAYGTPSAGVPWTWGARDNRAGVSLLADFGEATLKAVTGQIMAAKRPGDLVVVSIHWGGNWGYDVPADQREFAHRLVDEAGVDLIHGHSSHHVKAFEVYQGRLILHGCGDFLNDYEGISGGEEYRPALTLMYFPTLRAADGRLERLRMVPMHVRRFRLARASRGETRWLADTLNRVGRPFGARVEVTPDGELEYRRDGNG